jgi:hypothetical protein
LTVKITRPGLKVRYRSGFFNVTDEKAKPLNATPQQQIFNALSSPFASGQIAVKLTPLFSLNNKRESFINAFIHVKASDLKFTELADGWKRISFDIVVVAFGDNGTVTDQLARTENIRMRGLAYETVSREGFVYTVQFPIKKPGGYQLRIALRDTATSHIGSANQFIEVPNIKKVRLTLSGMVLQQMRSEDKKAATQEEKETELSSARQDTSLRKFKAGSVLAYNLSAYYSPTVRADAKPALKTQVKLFQNGKLIYTGKEGDYNSEGRVPGETILGGAFQLGEKMEPGDYVLQLLVKDLTAKPKDQIRSQWLDFEVVK